MQSSELVCLVAALHLKFSSFTNNLDDLGRTSKSSLHQHLYNTLLRVARLRIIREDLTSPSVQVRLSSEVGIEPVKSCGSPHRYGPLQTAFVLRAGLL